MPRNMSFALTQQQFRDRTKTVTRRLGWRFLKPGDILNGCEKCQGLKAGERIVKLGQIRILSTDWQPLDNITAEDCAAEGFPDLTPAEFVAFFCQANGCEADAMVNRIKFEYLESQS